MEKDNLKNEISSTDSVNVEEKESKKERTKTMLFGFASKRKALFISLTAAILAITIGLQWLSGMLGIQLLTGSIVNMLLILTTLIVGLVGGLIVGLCTPFIAFFIGLSANIMLTPFIAISNLIYVTVFALFTTYVHFGKASDKKGIETLKQTAVAVIAMILASGLKCLFLTVFTVELILPLFMVVKPPIKIMLGVLQLFTALIGGTCAVALRYPVLLAMSKTVKK